jgi:uncharacterized membrane protein YjdF
MMPLLAEATQKLTPLQKIGNVSGQFWLKLILCVIAVSLLLWFFRVLKGANKIILVIVLTVIVAIVGFNWVYERNEPEWATPFVSTLAQWLPTKGAYDGKQQQDPGNPGIKKNAPAQKPTSGGNTTTTPKK